MSSSTVTLLPPTEVHLQTHNGDTPTKGPSWRKTMSTQTTPTRAPRKPTQTNTETRNLPTQYARTEQEHAARHRGGGTSKHRAT